MAVRGVKSCTAQAGFTRRFYAASRFSGWTSTLSRVFQQGGGFYVLFFTCSFLDLWSPWRRGSCRSSVLWSTGRSTNRSVWTWKMAFLTRPPSGTPSPSSPRVKQACWKRICCYFMLYGLWAAAVSKIICSLIVKGAEMPRIGSMIYVWGQTTWAAGCPLQIREGDVWAGGLLEAAVWVYLLVLVGGHCGELGLQEGEAVHAFGRQGPDLRQVHPRVVPDDVHTRLVLMHRLQDDLEMEISASDPKITLFILNP